MQDIDTWEFTLYDTTRPSLAALAEALIRTGTRAGPAMRLSADMGRGISAFVPLQFKTDEAREHFAEILGKRGKLRKQGRLHVN